MAVIFICNLVESQRTRLGVASICSLTIYEHSGNAKMNSQKSVKVRLDWLHAMDMSKMDLNNQ